MAVYDPAASPTSLQSVLSAVSAEPSLSSSTALVTTGTKKATLADLLGILENYPAPLIAAGMTAFAGEGYNVDGAADATVQAEIDRLIALGWPAGRVFWNDLGAASATASAANISITPQISAANATVSASAATAANISITPSISAALASGTAVAAGMSITPQIGSGDAVAVGAAVAANISITPQIGAAVAVGVAAADGMSVTPTIGAADAIEAEEAAAAEAAGISITPQIGAGSAVGIAVAAGVSVTPQIGAGEATVVSSGPIASDDFTGTLASWGTPIYTGAGTFTGSSDVIDTANSRVVMTFVRSSSAGAATMRVPWTTSYTAVAGRAFVVEGHALRITFANGAYLTIEKHPTPIWVGEEPNDYETRVVFVDGYTSGGVNSVTQSYEYAVANDSNVLKVAFVDATHIDVFVGGVKIVSNRDISPTLLSGNATPERYIYWENATGTRTEYVYGFEVY